MKNVRQRSWKASIQERFVRCWKRGNRRSISIETALRAPNPQKVVAELCGNLTGLLNPDERTDRFDNDSAGRGILTQLTQYPLGRFIAA